MKSNRNEYNYLNNYILTFEEEKIQKIGKDEVNGIVYTPLHVADLVTNNAFKCYFSDVLKKTHLLSDIQVNDLEKTNLLKFIKNQTENIKKKLWEKISLIKFLDPSCGSGRFLLSIANLLLEFNQILNPTISIKEIKKHIIENNLYGVDIEEDATIASKARMIIWYFQSETQFREINPESDIISIIECSNLNFNIYNSDFLFEFENKQFDIIIGNPPYIENKKIENLEYKQKLKTFECAYGLYDL